jgi:biotin carboxyl carrier protein
VKDFSVELSSPSMTFRISIKTADQGDGQWFSPRMVKTVDIADTSIKVKHHYHVPESCGKESHVASPINVPKLGWTMEEGILSAWLAEDGATVTEGEPLYVLENDKVENEIPAPASGVLHRSGVPGETYAVGTEIGRIE